MLNHRLEQMAQVVYNHIFNASKEMKPLSAFISIKHGYAFKGYFISSVDNGMILVTPGNFKIGGGFQEGNKKFYFGEVPKQYILSPRDLIITMTDLSKNGDTLGYSAFVPESKDRTYLHNQRIGLVNMISDELPISYIYWYLRSYNYQQKILGSASGSTVKHTSPSRILEQQIPIPKKSDAELYYPILDSINADVSNNDKENLELIILRNTLLPKLMSGELSVSQATK